MPYTLMRAFLQHYDVVYVFRYVICCSQRTGSCIHNVCCYKVRVMAEIGGVQDAECTNLHQFEMAGRSGLVRLVGGWIVHSATTLPTGLRAHRCLSSSPGNCRRHSPSDFGRVWSFSIHVPTPNFHGVACSHSTYGHHFPAGSGRK